MDMESIYREYHDKLFSFISYKVGNREDAEDILSEVFLKIQKNLDKYEESKASFARWIYVIAGNTIIDFYRSRKPSEEIPEDLPTEEDLEDKALNRLTLSNLRNALLELSEEERLIIVLHYYEDMSLKDIEKKTGLSYGQVKIRHNNALKVLRKFL